MISLSGVLVSTKKVCIDICLRKGAIGMREMKFRVEFPAAASEQDRVYIVTELCPHCGHEIEMRWDTDDLGFAAFCPVCGRRLMLCDECRHTASASSCDYSSETDRCYKNSPKDAPHQYVVTIEEHISQDFPVDACDISTAMETAREQYLNGTLVVQPSPPTARLMMAQAEEGDEVTEWKEF